MRVDGDGRVVLDDGEVRVLALALPVAARELERRDGVRDPRLERLAYEAALYAGLVGAGPSVLASVTDIATAPSRRVWVDCAGCGRSTDRPRRGLCDRCRKAEDRARARGQAGDSGSLSA